MKKQTIHLIRAALLTLSCVLAVLPVAGLSAEVDLSDMVVSGSAPSIEVFGVESKGEGDIPSDSVEILEGAAPDGLGGGVVHGPFDFMTDEERQRIQEELNQSIKTLEAVGVLSAASPMSMYFSWPLRPSKKLSDYGYHGISGFVDHDYDYPNRLLDYNCGKRTYDRSSGYNHKGTDFFLWPFTWNKMDNKEVEIVAAAPGIIIKKSDGNFDRNCSMGSGTWNAVYLRHADGSVAWYGHMKKGSVTSKAIGDSVARSEYLGVVGSSGSSTGPHLHLEVYGAGNELVDPYKGTCNELNSNSWWASQRPYYDSAINKITTGSNAPVFNSCPNQAAPNIRDSFNPGDTIYFTTYYRDQRNSQKSTYTIYRPNKSVYSSWTHISNAYHYRASYWYWHFNMDSNAPIGTWLFEVVYNGRTYLTHFNIGVPTAIKVARPNGGEVWKTGESRTIKWTDNIGGKVRIELYKNGGYVDTIAAQTASDGAFGWEIPRALKPSSQYRIRITDLADTSVYDTSNTNFSITN